jgi:hypothetical protein
MSIQLTLFDETTELGVDLVNVANTAASRDKWEKQKCRDFGYEQCLNAIFSGKYGIPLIKAYRKEVPESFVSIGDVYKGKVISQDCVTGFEYDIVLDKFWENPEKHIDVLKNAKCVSEMDFSLYINTPPALQIANTWRSHVLSFVMQEHGIPVLPAPTWSYTTSYDYCFDGHEKGGVVLVSTIGTLRNDKSQMYFKEGFFEMLKRLDPEEVILYGDVPEKS